MTRIETQFKPKLNLRSKEPQGCSLLKEFHNYLSPDVMIWFILYCQLLTEKYAMEGNKINSKLDLN